MLIAALNPCPCGYRGDSRRSCNCTTPQIERYMSKISGPAAWTASTSTSRSRPCPFASCPAGRRAPPAPRCGPWWPPPGSGRPRGSTARRRATTPTCRTARPASSASWTTSAAICLKGAMTEMGLSARAHDKILRVARTIADLDNSDGREAAPSERGDQLPHAGSEFVDVSDAGTIVVNGETIRTRMRRRKRDMITFRISADVSGRPPGNPATSAGGAGRKKRFRCHGGDPI